MLSQRQLRSVRHARAIRESREKSPGNKNYLFSLKEYNCSHVYDLASGRIIEKESGSGWVDNRYKALCVLRHRASENESEAWSISNEIDIAKRR